MRRALAAVVVAACAVPVAQYPGDDGPDAGGPDADTPIAVGARRPGAAVRVEATRWRTGLAAYAGVWRHNDPDQMEILAIMRTGAFDWSIERPGSRCQIAGTVAVVEGDPPALAWTMTTNTCNSSYQGRTSNDNVIAKGFDRMTLKDAEFEIDPVEYERDR
jgi:hypothetical protein